MNGFILGALAVALGLGVIGLQIYRNGQDKPTPAWEVSSVEVETSYRMKSGGLKGYVIVSSSRRVTAGTAFRVFKYENGRFLLNDFASSFREAERIALNHAGLAALEDQPND